MTKRIPKPVRLKVITRRRSWLETLLNWFITLDWQRTEVKYWPVFHGEEGYSECVMEISWLADKKLDYKVKRK